MATGTVSRQWQLSTPNRINYTPQSSTNHQKFITDDYNDKCCSYAKLGANPSTGTSGQTGEMYACISPTGQTARDTYRLVSATATRQRGMDLSGREVRGFNPQETWLPPTEDQKNQGLTCETPPPRKKTYNCKLWTK